MIFVPAIGLLYILRIEGERNEEGGMGRQMHSGKTGYLSQLES